jgi:hypothetical protein
VLIILHDPMFNHGGKVKGTLTARHTIALSVDGGVIVLDRADVLKVLPALIMFAELPAEEEDDE